MLANSTIWKCIRHCKFFDPFFRTILICFEFSRLIFLSMQKATATPIWPLPIGIDVKHMQPLFLMGTRFSASQRCSLVSYPTKS